MSTLAIRPADHLPMLDAIAATYPVRLQGIEVVPSIRDWSVAHGLEESSHSRMGKTVVNNETGASLILLAAEITPEMQSQVIFGMEARGHFDEAQPLRGDARAFIVHLLLHEMAHARFPDATEIECDDWAFAELPRHHPPASAG
ncbi:MAG: hypothetical protein WA900_10760 [Casimicrobiaceae bacterium]